ncbi:MAG: hypothetical protein V4503_01020, partial [Gemmatimonadota bacterium]
QINAETAGGIAHRHQAGGCQHEGSADHPPRVQVLAPHRQQQRLCLARTIAPEPEVILLDEPTASLDPQGTQRIEELVIELKKEFTIVIVTHNMQQAARVSDTTTFFYLGTMIEHGLTNQIFTAPANEQTEAYITGRFG